MTFVLRFYLLQIGAAILATHAVVTGSGLDLYPVNPYSRFKRECEEKHGSFSLANVIFGYMNMHL